MPSWVVPAVAAEMWAVPVEQVIADAEAGRVPSRTEAGLLFVDIDPACQPSHADETPPPVAYRRSLAWVMSPAGAQPIVTAEERDALLDEGIEAEPAAPTAALPEGAATHDAGHDDDDDDEEAPEGDAPEPTELTAADVPDWAAVRARVARTRRGPGMRDAA